MPIDRFFVEERLREGEEVALREEEAHHLISVARGKVNEEIELVNGKNELGLGQIREMRKREVIISVEKVIQRPSKGIRRILAQGIPRLPRLDTILEKGCELGLTEIWLFPGMRSEKSEFSSQQLLRMKRILISAMKQCGRLDLPEIVLKPPLKKWNASDLLTPAYLGDTKETTPFQSVWKNEKNCLFFIGPESGFTDEEIALLHQFGVKNVSLHENTLRTDTAAILAIGLMNV